MKQAPVLQYDREKPQANNFYQIPQPVADKVFAELGNSSAQLRIMLVLIGTKPGFAISEQWICDRTGLLKPSYITARKELVKKGWLTLVDATSITVNFNMIMKDDNTETENNRGNTILPNEGNTILPQRGNTTLPIINNKINNKIDNLSVEPQARSREEAIRDVMSNSTNSEGKFNF